MGLCCDNNLMLGIDSGNAGVALDAPFVGRHLGALIIGAITFDDRAACPMTVMGGWRATREVGRVMCEPL